MKRGRGAQNQVLERSQRYEDIGFVHSTGQNKHRNVTEDSDIRVTYTESQNVGLPSGYFKLEWIRGTFAQMCPCNKSLRYHV